MLKNLFKAHADGGDQRELARLSPVVEQINALEPATQALSNDQLVEMTRGFQQRLREATAAYQQQISELQGQVDR